MRLRPARRCSSARTEGKGRRRLPRLTRTTRARPAATNGSASSLPSHPMGWPNVRRAPERGQSARETNGRSPVGVTPSPRCAQRKRCRGADLRVEPRGRRRRLAGVGEGYPRRSQVLGRCAELVRAHERTHSGRPGLWRRGAGSQEPWAGPRAAPADDQKSGLLRCSAGGASGGTAGDRATSGDDVAPGQVGPSGAALRLALQGSRRAWGQAARACTLLWWRATGALQV